MPSNGGKVGKCTRGSGADEELQKNHILTIQFFNFRGKCRVNLDYCFPTREAFRFKRFLLRALGEPSTSQTLHPGGRWESLK